VAAKKRKSTTEVVRTFMSSVNDRRTKLPVSLIKKFNAEHGNTLYFYKVNELIVATKSVIQTGSRLFEISVDVENRARLTEKNLSCLGAVFGDDLEFKFVDSNEAIVTVRQQIPVWEEHDSPLFPEELESLQTYIEGATKQITINAYERDLKARQACIDYYGLDCSICGFNFEKIYGYVGRDYIHVHHLNPISSIGEEYMLDPIKDLRPICPNCHAIVHRKRPPYTVEEVRNILRQIV